MGTAGPGGEGGRRAGNVEGEPSRLVTDGEGGGRGRIASDLRLAETVLAVGSGARDHEPSDLPSALLMNVKDFFSFFKKKTMWR